MRFCKAILVFIGLVCTAALLCTEDALSEKERVSLAVLGVRKEIKEKAWDNQLIAQGLSNVLLQELCRTGRYVGVEHHPEILERLVRPSRYGWSRENLSSLSQNSTSLAEQLGVQATAYLVVKDFCLIRKRGFLGPITGGKTTVQVEVSVYLDEASHKSLQASGTGEGSTESLGAFFQLSEDKVYFDATTVGRAAKEAVKSAVEKLDIPK